MGKQRKTTKAFKSTSTVKDTRAQQQKGQQQTKDTVHKLTFDIRNFGEEWLYFLLFGVGVLAVYVYTMYPTLMGGDSGELMAAAQELGVAHPPGYPLFTVLSWLAIKIIPVEDVAWKVNLLNAIFSAAAGTIFAAVIYRYTDNMGCAIGGSAAWCFCKLTWTWSTSAEVFGLNNLFIVSLLYLMSVFQDSKLETRPKMACLGAFVCGLSLTNQHTLVIYVAIIAAWVLMELLSHKQLDYKLLLRIGVCFLVGMLPYIYLPLSAYLSNARWTWGDQRTIQGFLKHFLRQEYGTFDLAREASYVDKTLLVSKLGTYANHTLSEFSIAGPIFFLLGLKEALSWARYEKKYSLLVSTLMMVVYLLFFSWRANLNMAKPLLLGVVQRFWMQSDCVFVLIAAVGAVNLRKLFLLKLSDGETSKVMVGISLAVCACQLQQHFTECNQRDNRVIEQFGQRIMDNVPPNTFIFTKGDLPSNVFRYFYLSKNYRPDVTVFDQEVMTLKWSVPMLQEAYPQLTFPGDRMELVTGYIQGTSTKVFNAKTFLDENIKKFPIVVCIGFQDHDKSWESEYETFPFGPCGLVYKKGTNIDLNALTKISLNISATWEHPFQGFDETSWERVATDEMWNAKTNIGLHLYLKAIDEDVEEEKKSAYLVKAYEVYRNAINELDPDDVPVYWHKNFGLVCERLLVVEHKLSNMKLAKTSLHHFQQYLYKNPKDKDVPAIQMVIHNLKVQIAEHQGKDEKEKEEE